MDSPLGNCSLHAHGFCDARHGEYQRGTGQGYVISLGVLVNFPPGIADVYGEAAQAVHFGETSAGVFAPLAESGKAETEVSEQRRNHDGPSRESTLNFSACFKDDVSRGMLPQRFRAAKN